MFNRSVNKVVLVGNLGKDPEIRWMPNGAAVATFSIATTESWKDKQSGERKDKTEWHKLVVFNRLGEMCGEYLKKGAKIYVEGKLQTRKWQGQDGQDRYTTEVVVAEIQMMDSRNPAQAPGSIKEYQQYDQTPKQQNFNQTPKNQYYDQTSQQRHSQGQINNQRQQAPAHQPQNAPQQNAQPKQSWGNAPQQATAQQQAPVQHYEQPMDFDDKIPF